MTHFGLKKLFYMISEKCICIHWRCQFALLISLSFEMYAARSFLFSYLGKVLCIHITILFFVLLQVWRVQSI